MAMVRGRAATEPAGRRPKAAENRLVHSVVVANIKSQIKRNRQNERRHERNKGVRSALKTEAKKVRTSVAEGDAEAARQRLLEASRSLDQAASNGVLHKRAAARRKSRLAKAVNASTAE
jgi:small subunit ribosomal protein S20